MKPTVAVFAGQGAQFVGMGRELAQADAEILALFDRANAVLGFDLKRLCFEGPIEELTRSNVCQPAIFLASAACWTALRKRSPATAFQAVAGLSLGEWTALYAAGVLTFDETLRVLEARGRFMQQACDATAGGMVSVMGLSADQLRDVCQQSGLFMANINSEQQTVLSGPKAAVAVGEQLAAGLGARTVVLNVAGAFHSPLMAPARAQLAELLATLTFRAPTLPVLSNVTGQPHGAPDAIRELMLRQVTESVRWLDCITWCTRQGVARVIELGPGKVLSGLIKRIDKQLAVLNIQDAASLEQTVAALNA